MVLDISKELCLKYKLKIIFGYPQLIPKNRNLGQFGSKTTIIGNRDGVSKGKISPIFKNKEKTKKI